MVLGSIGSNRPADADLTRQSVEQMLNTRLSGVCNTMFVFSQGFASTSSSVTPCGVASNVAVLPQSGASQVTVVNCVF